MLRRLRLLIAAMALGLIASSLPARAEDLPIIVTYELRKERLAERSAAREPKRFWIRQVYNRIEDKMIQLRTASAGASTVRLSFSVAHDGRLLSKAVSSSSGDAKLDRAAMAVIAGAAPFPPMPEAMSDSEMTFALPVRFR